MSLSKGRRFFSKDELSALKVWQAPDVSGRKVEDVAIDPNAQPILTVTEIEAMQKQAYDEGFEQGKVAGYDAGFSEGKAAGFEVGTLEGIKAGKEQGYNENQYLLQEQVVRFIPLLESLNKPLEALDEKVEKSLVHLVILIAKHVIQKELSLAPEHIAVIVKETIKLLPVADQKITLSLHPDDASLLREAFSLQDDVGWVINDDPEIAQGGVVVNTVISHIDATVDKRLSEIIVAVLGEEVFVEGHAE